MAKKQTRPIGEVTLDCQDTLRKLLRELLRLLDRADGGPKPQQAYRIKVTARKSSTAAQPRARRNK